MAARDRPVTPPIAQHMEMQITTNNAKQSAHPMNMQLTQLDDGNEEEASELSRSEYSIDQDEKQTEDSMKLFNDKYSRKTSVSMKSSHKMFLPINTLNEEKSESSHPQQRNARNSITLSQPISPILNESMFDKIKATKIYPTSIELERTLAIKQKYVLQRDHAELNAKQDCIKSSCQSIIDFVKQQQKHEPFGSANKFTNEEYESTEIKENDIKTNIRRETHRNNHDEYSQSEEYDVLMRGKTENFEKYVSNNKRKEDSDADKNKAHSTKCCGQFTKSITFTFQVAARALSLVDIITDSILLYTSSQVPELWYLTLTLVLSMAAPYIISYSSGIQLYLFRQTFDNVKGFNKILMMLFVLPTGIFYFIFLDLVDIYLRLFRWMYFVLCCKSLKEMGEYEQILAKQLGMDRMNWEGFKVQRSIGQTMFESIPQFIVQTIVFYFLNLEDIVKNDGNILAQTSVNDTQLLISIVSALINIIITTISIKLDAKCCHSGFMSYALTCVKARVDWIPQSNKIAEINELYELQKSESNNGITKREIDYKMEYKLIGKSVDYDFSIITINRLMSMLLGIDVSKKCLLTIKFRDSLRLVPLQNIIDLLALCERKNVEVEIQDPGATFDFTTAIEMSVKYKRDIRILQHSRDDQGLPYIMKLMQLTQYKDRQKVFQSLIQNNDFDLNIYDLITNESVIYTLIRTFDYENLEYIFNQYGKNKGVLIRLNYHNKDGISPLA
eukprot:180636_1